MTPISSAQTAPVSLTPYREFLYRQALRITARGGSLADVGDYIQHAEDRPLRAVVEAQNNSLVDKAPGPIRGFAQQMLQGATLYYGDEALGSLYGIVSGQGAQAGRDLYRQELAAYEQQHQKTAIAAQLLGGLGLARLVPGSGSPGPTGAAVGAVAGSGAGEGDLSERTRGALWGAGLGFVFGAATRPVGKAIGRAGEAAATKLAPITRAVGTTLQPVMRRVEQTLRAGLDRLPGSPARVARQMLRDALLLDGKTAGRAAALAEQRAAHGLPTTVADLGGDHTMALATLVQQFRTPEQQALVQQLAARGSLTDARLLGTVTRNLRLGTQNAYELAEQISARQIAQAAPFYTEAFQATVPTSENLRRLLRIEPRFRQAYEIGRQKANLEDLAAQMTGRPARGLPVPELLPQRGALRPGEVAQRIPGTREISITGPRATPPVPTKGTPQPRAFQVSGEAEELAIPDQLPVRAIDYMKRGIDDMVNSFTAEGKPVLTQQDGRAMGQLLRVVREEVAEVVPAYKRALGIWEDFSIQLDEMARARGFLTKPPEVVAREVAAAKARSPQALEAYRVQAVQDLADALHGGPATPEAAGRLFGAQLYGTDRTALRRIQALFDDPVQAEDFADKVAGEAAALRSTKQLGRRGTPRPQAAARQLTPPGVTQRVLQRTGMRGPQSTTRAQAIANEVTNLFTRGLDDPNHLVALLRNLDGLERSAQAYAAMVRVAAGQQAGAQQRP